jgi:hypothetical protein
MSRNVGIRAVVGESCQSRLVGQLETVAPPKMVGRERSSPSWAVPQLYYEASVDDPT